MAKDTNQNVKTTFIGGGSQMWAPKIKLDRCRSKEDVTEVLLPPRLVSRLSCGISRIPPVRNIGVKSI
jgi:hypothetical protein